MNAKQQIQQALLALATISGKELTALSLNSYIEALSDLPSEAVLASISLWLRTERGFPYPSDIRQKIAPEIDDKDNSQIVANLIISAISRFGYTNSDAARKNIGELAWAVAVKMGGWKHLCEVLTNENEGMYRAQIRGFAETVSKQAKRGELNESPMLPDSSSEVKKLIGITFK